MYVCLCVEKVMMECVVLLKDEEMLEGACQAIAHTTTTHTKREETTPILLQALFCLRTSIK